MATSVAIVAQLAHMRQDEDYWDTGGQRSSWKGTYGKLMIQEHIGATLYGQTIRENYGSKAHIFM